MVEQAVFSEFRELLTDAVRLGLRSDVPVGFCLSGGLDSSAIVCIVRKLLGQDAPYNTFAGRFLGTSADEWHYAEQVIDATGVISHTVKPTVDRSVDDLPRFIWANELPVGISSQFAQWCVFDLARKQGVTVLLDGQGARLTRKLPIVRARYPLALAPPARALGDRLPFRLRHSMSNRFGFGTNMLYGIKPELAMRIMRKGSPTRREGFDELGSTLLQESFGRYRKWHHITACKPGQPLPGVFVPACWIHKENRIQIQAVDHDLGIWRILVAVAVQHFGMHNINKLGSTRKS